MSVLIEVEGEASTQARKEERTGSVPAQTNEDRSDRAVVIARSREDGGDVLADGWCRGTDEEKASVVGRKHARGTSVGGRGREIKRKQASAEASL